MFSAQNRLYNAYGCAIASDLVIPEFPTGPKSWNLVDVRIKLRPPQLPPSSLQAKHWHFDVNRQYAHLYFRGVAQFMLERGRIIVVTPVPGADQRLIELYLSGTVFAVLLFQQGKLVMHASSVGLKTGETVVVAGESGAGKSSLAAWLWRRGYFLLSDDASALSVNDTQSIELVPAFPQIKVDAELSRSLHLDPEALRPVHEREDKSFFCCHTSLPGTVWAVKCLIVLEQGKQRKFVSLKLQETMIELVRHTVPTRLLHSVGDARHFFQCGRLASRVPAYRLVRSESTPLDWLADQVESVLNRLME